ncbi:MAG: hypothetical protein RSD76_06205, partial [Clostridia bacterium]
MGREGPAGGWVGLAIPCFPCATGVGGAARKGTGGIAEMAFRATGVGTAPHTGTSPQKSMQKTAARDSDQKPLNADERRGG